MENAVCWKCFEDSYFSEIVRKNGDRVHCSVCGNKRRNGYTVEEIGKELEQVIRENYQLGDFYRKFSGEDDDHGYEEQEGDDLNYVVQEVLGQYFEFEDEIVGAVIEAEDVWPPDGDVPFFASDSFYVRCPIHSGDLYYRWQELGDELKHRRRFFSQQANELFGWLFEGIDDVISLHPFAQGSSVVRNLPVGSTVYRARVCNPSSLQRMFDAPFKEVGPPPIEHASEGRMNAKGVSVLYAALERETCLAEIRPAIGHNVVSVDLRTIRPLRVLDFSWLSEALGLENQSYFQPNYRQAASRSVFLRRLNDMISQPVVPGREAEYLITQSMAEYLANVHPKPFDGIMFNSVQRIGGRNIVLFPDHSVTEGPVVALVDDPVEMSNERLFGIEYVPQSFRVFSTASVIYDHQQLQIFEDEDGQVSTHREFDEFDDY